MGASADVPPLSLETTTSTPQEFGKEVLDRIPDGVANVPATDNVDAIKNAELMAKALDAPSTGSAIPLNAVPASTANIKERSDLLGLLAEYNGMKGVVDNCPEACCDVFYMRLMINKRATRCLIG